MKDEIPTVKISKIKKTIKIPETFGSLDHKNKKGNHLLTNIDKTRPVLHMM